MTVVEESSEAFLARHFGDEGRAWPATVPGTLSELAEEWQLGLGARLRGGLLAIVHEATTSSGEQVVRESRESLGSSSGGDRLPRSVGPAAAHRGCSRGPGARRNAARADRAGGPRARRRRG